MTKQSAGHKNYYRAQDQPFLTETRGAQGGFGGLGACAACRAFCDCTCVRRTCIDTSRSCCGDGEFAPETTTPSPPQEQPLVTGTTEATGGFGGACAACRYVCDCACVRRTCVDTSCCGEGGFAPETTSPSPGYRQDIFEDPRSRILSYLQQKLDYLIKHP
ncbi:unnamed protein product [Mytilus edulis]|uniref:Uncharacterized protein n=1 Tax=Mytilus edulis TaxID=6550 RepID=A0A8S3SVM9_MYTED|nr:unnamed protein product [Mytilus edulis]